MITWIIADKTTTNIDYILILLGILIVIDIIACVRYVSLVKEEKSKKISKKK